MLLKTEVHAWFIQGIYNVYTGYIKRGVFIVLFDLRQRLVNRFLLNKVLAEHTTHTCSLFCFNTRQHLVDCSLLCFDTRQHLADCSLVCFNMRQQLVDCA